MTLLRCGKIIQFHNFMTDYFFKVFMIFHCSMAVSYLGVLLQVMAGSVASFVIGMMWFSPSCLGRTWWSYSFPNKKYGECDKQNTV